MDDGLAYQSQWVFLCLRLESGVISKKIRFSRSVLCNVTSSYKAAMDNGRNYISTLITTTFCKTNRDTIFGPPLSINFQNGYMEIRFILTLKPIYSGNVCRAHS